MTQTAAIRPKERDSILHSLRAGVVPRSGIHHIQVGRVNEVKALLRDIERIKDGGGTIRFVIGEYGAGKTFFLQLVRSVALEQGLVTAGADLTPDRRLHATGGQARALYAEMMRNLSTRTKWDGGGLPSVVERFIATAVKEGKEAGKGVEPVIHEKLQHLSEMVGGYDFAEVIAAYWRGHDTGNEALKSDAIRWLRGEFTTKTDARRTLGVRTIVDDSNIYDQLKLMGRFVRQASYQGLLVTVDEMVNLYKLSNVKARTANYEQILCILNDALQGSTEGLGFVLGGTPESLMDTRKGIYSYTALQSRLAENSFAASAGVADYQGPVIRLASLTPEDLYVLLTRLRHVQAGGNTAKYLVPDEALHAFLEHCSKRIGDAYFRTPRNTIRSFLDMVSVLEQNPSLSWQQLVGQVNILTESNRDLEPLPEDEGGDGKPDVPTSPTDELSDFRL
ncbi:MAG: ATP-binding protein [Pseudomonadota bacterium]